jgi:anaerobic selenocysteine-containing dehydrogenase
MKLVTFDTRLTRTAAKSRRWFCPNPGSESFIALAMAKHIVDKGLHNEPFMRQWTNASPQEVVRHLSPYTLKKAEELSGIPASEIETAAVEFAATKPAVALSGDATTQDARGAQTARSIALLNIITGNVDTPGAYCLPRRYPVGDIDNLSACQAAQSFFPGLAEKSRASQVYIAYKANPAYSNPDTRRTLEVLNDEKVLPFVVVMDTTMSETGMLADLFLPTTTHLEQWGLVSRPSLTMVPWVGIQQPVTEPLGESRPIHDILIDLAQAVGAPVDEEFPSPSVESYLSSDLSLTPELNEAGGLDLLKRKGAFWKKEEKPRYRLYEKEGFPTPSGKLEIYSPTVKERGGSPMPVYEPPPEPLEGTLVLTLYEENVLTQNVANAKWLSEISHRGGVLINPQTAEARGIKTGEHVRISSLIGSVTAKAILSEGVHPRVIALPAHLGHWSFGSTAKGKHFESEDPDTHLIWWGEEAHRVHPQSLVMYSFDPIGGGVAWRDTLVTVTKVESGGDRDHS